MNTKIATLLIMGTTFLGGCQTVHKDLEKAIIPDGNRQIKDAEAKPKGEVQVPDLDKRSEGTQFLSEIDRLEKETFELRNQLKTALTERDEALEVKNAAAKSETELAEMIEEYQVSLASSADQIKKLRARCLRIELESVRYQQQLADMKIRQLTEGESQ